MPEARYRLVDTETTPYYHCVSRCVRRAFLCGSDNLTGKNFDHRKQWIVNRIRQLSSIFAIDVCAYAVMSNHFHLVLHIEPARASEWTMDEVITRWTSLFAGTEPSQLYLAGESISQSDYQVLENHAEVWRQRLTDLSWYMRCLNENIARLANAEDDCTGRFWEGRFKSQALLNEAALCACMAYVDLNPIRAGLCQALEDSDFTSIQERVKKYRQDHNSNKHSSQKALIGSWLRPLRLERDLPSKKTMPIALESYFMLVDWTGRSVRNNKGIIPDHISPILKQLNINEKNWLSNIKYFDSRIYRTLGRVNQIRELARKTQKRWLKGMTFASSFYLHQ